jgi:DNA-binding NarL/FixJ family response regulator
MAATSRAVRIYAEPAPAVREVAPPGPAPATRPPNASQPRRRPTALVATPRPSSRVGICAVVDDAGFAVVARVATAEAAIAEALARRPDVCIVDTSLAGGLDAARAIASRLPGTGTLVLADAASDHDVISALRTGLAGYLPRSISVARFRLALHAVAAGDASVPRTVVDALIRGDGERSRRRAARVAGCDVVLSAREWDVAALLRRGLLTQGIAAELGISVVTVRRHLGNLREKLGAPDRATALRLLEESGAFADVPDPRDG